MMWITLSLITLVWSSQTQAEGRRSSNQVKNEVTRSPLLPDVRDSHPTSCTTLKPTVSQSSCENVISDCSNGGPWTKCFEDRIGTCVQKARFDSSFIRRWVNASQEAEASPSPYYRVHVPSSALKRSRGAVSQEEVLLVATVINSTFFKLTPSQGPRRGRGSFPAPLTHIQGTVLGGFVLAVRAGNIPVQNLSETVKLIFKHDKQGENGTCVFWQESDDGTGHWNRDGCDTIDTGAEFICSCNHLSFFAVLVNPVLSVDKRNAVTLNYITYTGSALSVFFTVITLFIYICLLRRRPEKAIGVHMQLTGALFCLHLSFVLCCLWVSLLNEKEDGWVCRGLGLFLHWSLLASFSWTALEGFHLYLLVVRVFNIYVRRYLLKLSLVGWGLPTLTVVACGISGVYGKFSLEAKDGYNQTSAMHMCWMSSQFPHRLIVSYITTVAFPCLVILYNACMLGLVLFKLWGLRRGSRSTESSGWKKANREKGSRLWKDGATVLGLSCVLGLPWGLMITTYMSLPGIYVFTILNSLQGVFMFLWSMALSCKSRSDNNSSVRDPSSSQKMMTTSI